MIKLYSVQIFFGIMLVVYSLDFGVEYQFRYAIVILLCTLFTIYNLIAELITEEPTQ